MYKVLALMAVGTGNNYGAVPGAVLVVFVMEATRFVTAWRRALRPVQAEARRSGSASPRRRRGVVAVGSAQTNVRGARSRARRGPRLQALHRSEERRVGKECRSRWMRED